MVDDEPDIRTIGEIALRDVGGLRVTMASSGREALDIAAGAPPDVILLDVMMPDMDGPTTLERLRQDERTRSVPVVFMTAKVQRTEVERYMRLGAAGVVAKPFDPMQLAAEVRRVVGNLAD
jgi:CheY-like chemotaxis protein